MGKSRGLGDLKLTEFKARFSKVSSIRGTAISRGYKVLYSEVGDQESLPQLWACI